MTQYINIAGYQGPTSILTRGLTMFRDVAFPDATLIPDVTAHGLAAQELFAGLERADFNIGYMASGYLSARVPELSVLDLPFSVSDRRRALEQLDGFVGRWFADAVARETGLVVLAFWDNGFRHLSNRQRPVRSPEDCEGLTVRTLNNQLYQDTMAKIGLTPVVTDVKELVSACETGRVDAQENPLTNMVGFGLDRWHKHVSLTGHIFGVILLVANRDWFEGLESDCRFRLTGAASMASRLQRQLAEDSDTECLTLLQERGVDVLGPDQIDLAAFRRSTANLRNDVLAGMPDELVNQYLQ